jgi:hypothetical protein
LLLKDPFGATDFAAFRIQKRGWPLKMRTSPLDGCDRESAGIDW